MRKHKNKWVLVISLILLIFGFGLTVNAESFYWWHFGSTKLAEAEEGYYVMVGNYLYYVDEQTFAPTLLCVRPDCLHNNEENAYDCDAYYSYMGSIGFFEGDLYVQDAVLENGRRSSASALYKVHADGTGRRAYMDLYSAEELLRGDVALVINHCFYTMSKPIEGENDAEESIKEESFLYARDLKNPKADPILIDTWRNTEEYFFMVQLLDDVLYYMRWSLEGKNSIWRYDLKSREKNLVLEDAKAGHFCVKNGYLYLLSGEDGIIRTDMQGNDRKQIFRFSSEEDRGFIVGDESYFYVYFKKDQDAQSAKEVLVINDDGEIVNRIPFPEPAALCLSMKKHLLFFREDADVPFCALPKARILEKDIKPVAIPYPEYLIPKEDQQWMQPQ